MSAEGISPQEVESLCVKPHEGTKVSFGILSKKPILFSMKVGLFVK